MVKNLPRNAGNMDLIPGRETKIPHATEQLNPQIATIDPVHCGSCTPQLESPCTTRKEPIAATKTRYSQIDK